MSFFAVFAVALRRYDSNSRPLVPWNVDLGSRRGSDAVLFQDNSVRVLVDRLRALMTASR